MNNTLNKLAQSVSGHKLIAIEGRCSSGKTTTAKKLADMCSGTHIDTDSYRILTGKETSLPPYLSRFNFDLIQKDINYALTLGSVFISGICLRALFEKIEISSTIYYIYIKRLSGTDGYWNDGEEIENYDKSSGIPTPHSCDIQYHIEYNPHQQANKIFHIIDPQ